MSNSFEKPSSWKIGLYTAMIYREIYVWRLYTKQFVCVSSMPIAKYTTLREWNCCVCFIYLLFPGFLKHTTADKRSLTLFPLRVCTLFTNTWQAANCFSNSITIKTHHKSSKSFVLIKFRASIYIIKYWNLTWISVVSCSWPKLMRDGCFFPLLQRFNGVSFNWTKLISIEDDSRRPNWRGQLIR